MVIRESSKRFSMSQLKDFVKILKMADGSDHNAYLMFFDSFSTWNLFWPKQSQINGWNFIKVLLLSVKYGQESCH